MQLKSKIFITFDIDWAADHLVNHVIDLCIKYNIQATFFATHYGEVLKRIRNYPNQFEIGLHPNFLPGSTQGTSDEEVFEYCKELVPDVVSIRTHCVYQHGRLYDLCNKYFGERIVDSSICMPGLDGIRPFELYTPSGCLVRVPFFWADDYYLLGKQKLNPCKLLSANGCRVYLFHPVHIRHNTISMDHYTCVKNNESSKNFEGTGIADIFNNVIQEIQKKNIKTGLMKEFLNY